ncbi:hypothetical protein SAMN06295900_102329 [Trinickia caryophylli]|uniref:Uncharacterized protein n=1 Tax=Trinickia caryophylli TaxID=28094 RepID=A0A1X7D2V6_TRICW|nr:hypothetical protein SAMN06295900_102329 [Trinickia caryophylli]
MIASNLCKTQCPFAMVRTSGTRPASSFLCETVRASAETPRRPETGKRFRENVSNRLRVFFATGRADLPNGAAL